MNWFRLKENVYYTDGTLRDICVKLTTRVDWKIWVDYINENYRVIWYNSKTLKEENQIDFQIVEDYWNGNEDSLSTAKIFIDKLQINAHFFDDSEIENDIDPKEFNAIEDHEKLIKFMFDLSHLLNKDVYLTPENEHDIILFKVSNKFDYNSEK